MMGGTRPVDRGLMAGWFHADQESARDPKEELAPRAPRCPSSRPLRAPRPGDWESCSRFWRRWPSLAAGGWQGTGEAGEPARARDGLVPGRWEAIRWPGVHSHRHSGGHEGGTQVPEPSLAPSAPGVCGHGRAVLISRPGARTSSPHLHRKHPNPLTNAFSGQAESPRCGLMVSLPIRGWGRPSPLMGAPLAVHKLSSPLLICLQAAPRSRGLTHIPSTRSHFAV